MEQNNKQTKIDASHWVILVIGILLGALIATIIVNNKFKVVGLKYIWAKNSLEHLIICIEKTEKGEDNIQFKDLKALSDGYKTWLKEIDKKQ